MFWRVVLVVMIGGLAAGCHGPVPVQPFAESRTPPDLASRFFQPEGWAWGFIQVGSNPPQRYGVVSTWRVPRATIIILPDTQDCTEAWFETATDLTHRRYSVWVLDRASECGSGRIRAPSDRVDVASFAPDIAAVKSLLRIVVRPNGDTPVILLGQGQGAILALSAVETGLKVDGLVLSSPSMKSTAEWRPWSRSTPDAFQSAKTHDPWRGHVTQSWMTANPDLRGSGPSSRWLRQATQFDQDARRNAKGLGLTTLILSPGPAFTKDLDLCGAIVTCSLIPLADARPALSLEQDRWRGPWLDAIVRFIAVKADAARRVGPDRNAPANPSVPSPVSEDQRSKDTISGSDQNSDL